MVATILAKLEEKRNSIADRDLDSDIIDHLKRTYPQNLGLGVEQQVHNAVFDSKGKSPFLARIALEILLTRPDFADLVVATDKPLDPDFISAEVERRNGSFDGLDKTDISYYLSLLGAGAALVSGENGFSFGRRLSDIDDYFLRQVYDSMTSGIEKGHALLVRGSHGRRLVAPLSDLDMVIIGESGNLQDIGKRFYERVHHPNFMDLDYGNEGMPIEHSLRTRGFKHQIDLSTNPNEAPYVARDHFIAELGGKNLGLESVLKASEFRFIAGDEEYARSTLGLIWEQLLYRRRELIDFAKGLVNEETHPYNLGQRLRYALLAYRLYRIIDQPTPDAIFDDLQKASSIPRDIIRSLVPTIEFQFCVRSQARILFGQPFVYTPDEPLSKDIAVFSQTFGYDARTFNDTYQYAKRTIENGIRQVTLGVR